MEKKEFVKPTTRVVELQAPVDMLVGSSSSPSTPSSETDVPVDMLVGSSSSPSTPSSETDVNATGLDAGEALRFGGESASADPWQFAW